MKKNWPVIRLAGLLGVSLALGAIPAQAQSAARPGTAQSNLVRAGLAASPAAAITRVETSRAGDQTVVRVEADSPLVYAAQHINHPERLVLDFTGARMATRTNAASSKLEPVERIRVGQFKPDVARVVIELDRALAYDVRTEGTTVVVTFAPTTLTQVAAAAPAVPAQKAVKLQAQTARVQAPARREKNSENLIADISKMPLPDSLTQRTASLASPKPQAPPAQEQGPVTQAPTPPQPQAPATQGQPATAGQPQRIQGSSGQKYTGEPISVNFKDLDLKDFFRLIHEISGLNVVLDPAVHGSLPALVLDDVPWDQALDIVLKNNSLDKDLEGNVLRIATQDTVKKEMEMKRDLAKAQQEAVAPETATRVLSYTKASVMQGTLKKWLSPHGDITADERTNTLIIRDIPAVLPEIDNLIRQLDRKSQQVEIEARVVQASRSFARDIGTQFAFSSTAVNGKNVFGGALGASPVFRPFIPGVSTSPAIVFGTPPTAPASGTPTATNVQMPLVTNLAAGSATTGLTYLFTSPNFALDYMITAAEAKGVGKLLSKPKIYTQNNEKGTVRQGNRVPIQTTINNTISVQYVDVVLKLEVTPQITADGTVFMQVVVENTQIDNGIPRVQGIPALDTQSVESSVLVNDGGTVVVGGVTVTSQRTDVSQVPLIGSVPVIGHLFKRTSVNVQSQELYFFLTPRIISN